MLDSGADEHCVLDEDKEIFFQSIDMEYSKNNSAPINLKNASGGNMTVTACGTVNSFMEKTMAVKDLDAALISTTKLQAIGCWIILPPSDLCSEFGGIVTDSNGKVIMVADKRMKTKLLAIGTYNDCITLPDLSSVLAIPTRISYRVYGLNNLPIRRMVHFVQTIFHDNKKNLMWKVQHVLGFPITQNQINLFLKIIFVP